MGVLRKSLLVVSVPLVLLVLVGTIRARVDESTDQVLRDLKVFSEVLYLVDNYYVEDVRLAQLERGAFQGLAESLDPWSSYWDPARMSKLAERDESGDIGLLLVKTPQQYVVVASVLPDSTADAAGVHQGQYLETIDGMATKDLTLLEAQHMLRGPIGSKVKLGYFRDRPEAEAGDAVEVARADLTPLAVVLESPADGTALIRVSRLEPGVSSQVAAILGEIQDRGVSKLVLDLRANLGGDPAEAVALADLFLEPREIYREKARDGEHRFSTTHPRAWTGELVTLIARGTVGEAELVAEALRAAGVGTLVGQPTFGKRSRQELVRLRDGSGIQLSVAEFLRADGEALDEDGVQPGERVARRSGESPDEAAADGGAAEVPTEGPKAAEADAPEADASDAAGAEPAAGADDDQQLLRALEILSGRERKAA